MLGYKEKTLIGNWYEERLSVPQISQTLPNESKIREVEPAISVQTCYGLLEKLDRISRHPAWNTSAVIADYSYREMSTTNQTAFVKPAERVEHRPHTSGPSMLTLDNFATVTNTDRPLPVEDGFRSPLKKPDPREQQRHLQTTSRAFFGEPQKEKVQHVTMLKTMSHGLSPTKRTTGKTGVLVGEKLKAGADPQEATHIQKAWQPAPDPGISNLYKRNEASLPDTDNELSLPLGDGNYFSSTGMRNQTNFSRGAGPFTKNPNLIPGVSTFSDYL